MTKEFCDGCGKELTDLPRYYKVGELEMKVGRNKKSLMKILIRDPDGDETTVESVKEPWLWYADLNFCVECFDKPIRLLDYMKDSLT